MHVLVVSACIMYEGKLPEESLRAVFHSDQWFLFHLIIFRSKLSFAAAWCLTRPSVMPCGCSDAIGQSVSPLCRLAKTRQVFLAVNTALMQWHQHFERMQFPSSKHLMRLLYHMLLTSKEC